MRRRFAPALAIVAALVVLGMGAGHSGTAWGQAPPDSPPADDPSATPESATEDDPVLERARQIEALLDGTLDPAIDPDALLRLDLSEAPFDQISLAKLEPPPPPPPPPQRGKRKKRAKAEVEVPAEPPASVDPETALRRAVARLVYASPDVVEAALQKARDQHEAHERAASEAARREKLRASQQRAAAKTRALLDGTLALEEDPSKALTVDLRVLAGSQPPAGAEPNEDATPPAEQPTDALAPEPDPADEEDSPIGDIERLLALDPEQRQALVDAHEQRRSEAASAEAQVEEEQDVVQAEELEAAEEAARLQEEALAEAAKARSELERARAEELARMRGVQADLANHAASLQDLDAEAKQRREWVLEFRRHVRDLKNARWTAAYDSAEADMRYADAVERLKVTRASFRELLERARTPGSRVPDPGTPDEALWTGDQGEKLRALHKEILDRHTELVAQTDEAVWEALAAVRDDTVSLNELRLELLTLSSAEHQAAHTGLGPEGVAQASREFEQIGLELSYQALSLPHTVRQIRSDAGVAPIPVFISLAKLVLMVLAFRWWRRRGPEWLEKQRDAWNEVRPQTRITRLVSGTAWYLQRIHKPLAWLVLGIVLVNLIDARYLPEVSLIKIAVVWTLGGMTVLQLLDAIASREDVRAGRPDDVAQLRLRSLTMVGWTIIAIGLSLSLAVDLVGAGAIYSWVVRAAWLVALPMGALLVVWWKPRIYERFREDTNDTAFRQWVLDRDGTWLAYPVAFLGGIFILLRQLFRALVRQASAAETTKRVLAYLFRREVAKRAADEGNAGLIPIDDGLRERILAREVHVDGYASAELEQLVAVAGSATDTLSVVIGPRGGGKSTLLARLRERLSLKVVVVDLDRLDPRDLVEQISAELATAGVDPSASPETHPERVVVLIDDVHLCVQPSVGGMRELDAFVDFAREASPTISWVFTASAPSWQYISRARADTLFLDQVIRMPPWTEEQIRELVMRQTSEAGVTVSFEDLVVPRQFDDRDYDEAERTRVGYFRILWDTAAGNPEVAMHFWLRSLHAGDDGLPHVRLFPDPSTRDLERVSFNALFVLRAIMQMEWASSEQLIACTRLGRADVLEAVRYCRARGYLEQRDDFYRLALHWHQPVSRLLGRQHLLAA